MLGVKTLEIRYYDLGTHICKADQEYWIVQTKSVNASDCALMEGISVPPFSKVTAIVGVITFSHAERYANVAAFRADEARHRIRPGSDADWARGRVHYKWHVSSVRRLQSPIPVESGQTGFGQPRTFQVAFAQSLSVFANEGAQASAGPPQSDARPASARVTNPSLGQQSTSARSASASSGVGRDVQPSRQQQQASGQSIVSSGSSSARFPSRHQQQPGGWNGRDRLPDDDMEAQVRREMDEWQKSYYTQNRWLHKVPADAWNNKRHEIRHRLWAERNRHLDGPFLR